VHKAAGKPRRRRNFQQEEEKMQTVRFFEDQGNPGDQRRLLIGIASCEESWDIDGGRREAVRVATTADATTYAAAYTEYMGQFEQQQADEVALEPG
jgi:hypothetical protein